MRLQIVLILASLFTFIYLIRKIRKHKLNIDDSILWIIWSLVLLVLSLVFLKNSIRIQKVLWNFLSF